MAKRKQPEQEQPEEKTTFDLIKAGPNPFQVIADLLDTLFEEMEKKSAKTENSQKSQ